jgi:hypothetical protein
VKNIAATERVGKKGRMWPQGWKRLTTPALKLGTASRNYDVNINTCRKVFLSKISPSFVDRYKYTGWWPASRKTGGRESDSADGVLLPPPFSFRVLFPSYCDVAEARRYFASSIAIKCWLLLLSKRGRPSTAIHVIHRFVISEQVGRKSVWQPYSDSVDVLQWH